MHNMAGTRGVKAFNLAKLFVIAIACSLAAGATSEAGASANDALLTNNTRLVVRRAADFGTLNYLCLFIDGVQVTTLALNEGFEAIVHPGAHVLSITTGPGAFGKQRITHRHVTMRRGETYTFTALWVEADLATLETGRGSNRVGWTGW